MQADGGYFSLRGWIGRWRRGLEKGGEWVDHDRGEEKVEAKELLGAVPRR